MIPPRRADATDDLDLVPGVLGLVALAVEVRALIAELAASAGADEVDADLVDLVLGVAALANTVASHVPREPEHESITVAEPRAPAASGGSVVVGELLR